MRCENRNPQMFCVLLEIRSFPIHKTMIFLPYCGYQRYDILCKMFNFLVIQMVSNRNNLFYMLCFSGLQHLQVQQQLQLAHPSHLVAEKEIKSPLVCESVIMLYRIGSFYNSWYPEQKHFSQKNPKISTDPNN